MREKAQPLTRFPDDAIVVTEYEELASYLRMFSGGKLNLVLLLGRPGIGKTEAVKEALLMQGGTDRRVMYVEGHAQPFGLYRELWRYRDCPVVLDDLDRLYANPDCVRILKPLCNTRRQKRISWVSHAVLSVPDLPTEFVTNSSVILIANEWQTANGNIRAIEDRTIIVWFSPVPDEIHRKTGEWFGDAEVYRFIGSYLPYASQLSMRHYDKGRRLREAGLPDWRKSVLQMILPDRMVAVVAGLQLDPRWQNDTYRVSRFTAETGLSRATYFRIKARIPKPLMRVDGAFP